METDIAQKILQIMFPLCAHLLELFCPFRSEVRRCEGESDLNDWPHGAKGLECRSATDSYTPYIAFFYRPRTLNGFRGQGAPIGRLGSIGRNIFFIIFPVTFKGDSSFANRL